MTVLFYLILLTHIWVMGITIVTQPGMLLYSLREWADEKHKAGNKWMEPLGLCHWCAPSIHSVFGYSFGYALGLLSGFEWRLFLCYPIVVMGASLANGLVWGLHKMIENKSKYLENMEKISYFDILDRKQKFRERKKV